MNANAYRTILVGAGLAAASAMAGCDARDEPEPYAEERTESAADSTYAAQDDTRATEPGGAMQTSPRDPATSMTEQPTMAGTSRLTETDVVGQAVVSQDGEEIGTVVQIVDDSTGTGQLAIVEVGEFLGIGEKQVAIDLRRLSLSADGQVKSDVTEDSLQAMPEYDASASAEEQGQEMAGQDTE